MKRPLRALRPASIAALTSLGLLGCSQMPPYHAPQAPSPAIQWNEQAPRSPQPDADSSLLWQPVTGEEKPLPSRWWVLLNDEVLSDLEAQLLAHSPGLAAAVARADAANAYVQQAQAAQSASVDASGAVTNNKQSKNRPLRGSNQPNDYDADTLGLNFNYEFDLWGRVRSAVAAGQAQAEAAQADLAGVQLSLTAALAENYLRLRGLQAQTALLDRTLGEYQRALDFTERRHRGGLASGLDVSRAQTQLSQVRTERSELAWQTAQYEHAIAALLGQPATGFSLAPAAQVARFKVPVGLPSTLLQHRPDVAVAERQVAAANARIGLAKAAFFPNFTLGMAYGYQNTGGPEWLSKPNSFWSIGPAAVLNLLDGGLRDAQLKIAQANLDETTAHYKTVAMAAFQETEDQLAKLTQYEQENRDQQDATQAAERTLKLSMTRYRDGAVNYLDVVQAQTTWLQIQRSALNLQTQNLLAGVGLVRALGGGWQPAP